MSFELASFAGNSSERSMMVIFWRPRLSKWYAVDIPKHPAPMMVILSEGEAAAKVEELSMIV
jgi:hypothetical protein